MEEFEPEVIGFFCEMCAYIAADTAGMARLQYPPNLKIIKVRCTGSVDPTSVIEAFAKGADGVLIVGCKFGHCHYQSGNYLARRRIALLKEVLPQFGINPKRLRAGWVAGMEGFRLAQMVTDFIADLKREHAEVESSRDEIS